MFENKQPTPNTNISKLGEFKLIEKLTKDIKISQPSTIRGIGDDAAVLNHGEMQTLVSTDLLVEGIHFNLTYSPLKHLGYKAIIVNLSDIYAMNGKATQVTVSIAVSNRFPLEALEELYDGMKLAAKIYGIDIVGGDTTSSQSGLMISVTSIGVQMPDKIVYRDGAKEKDLVVVSGDLGAAYLGFQILERERQIFEVNPKNQPDLELYQYLIERQLKPEARKDVVTILEELNVTPTSMIDISDGLSSEILHLCKASNLGCNLYEDKLPLDPQVISTCEELNIDSTTIAINGGEDYELLFTIAQSNYDKIKGNPNLSVIGHMTEANQPANLITRGQQTVPIIAKGWNGLQED